MNPGTKKRRNPLRYVNAISGSEASSSSTSIAPRGCLRFFLSNSSNLKTPMRPRPRLTVLSKTPKSAPLKTNKLKALNSKGRSYDESVGQSKSSASVTPLVLSMKVDDKSDSSTPPVQASVSPEILLGSSSAVSSASLACYAAGHVLSGIADKRKCRPRGILDVGDNAKALCSFDDDGSAQGMSDASLVPLPTEASMHWLLSPCKEEDEEHKEHSEASLLNPAASLRFEGQDVCGNNKLESIIFRSRRNNSVSPTGITRFPEPFNEHVPVSSAPDCEAPPLTDERQYIYDFDANNSPFSMASLGSGNVILTPQSDSSADGNAARSQYYESELNSVAEAIRMASLSPNHHELIEDQIDSSFQFDCLTTTCNSISRIQKLLDDQPSWHPNSTLEDVSQSQLRISWREGLMSRTFDMDEEDCCRCLSDEEEDIDGSSNDFPKESSESLEVSNNDGGDPILTDTCWSADILDDEPELASKTKEDLPHQSCAESISTDGSGLLASSDSDWNLYYKNELFHV